MLGNEFTISYAPKDEAIISNLSEKLYYEDINNITDINEDTISFRTMYIFDLEDKIEVKVFIINSTNNNVNFDKLSLSILNDANEIVASEDINLVDVGEIPPKNIRPYSIFFSKENLVPNKTINEKCKLIINYKRATADISSKTIIKYIDEKISLYDRRLIESYIDKMPSIIENNCKIESYKSSIDEEGNNYTILIVSNGYDQDVNLRELNLIYKDQAGMPQASKNIKLPLIKANSTSVFKIIIDKENVFREPFNPEQCTLTFK